MNGYYIFVLHFNFNHPNPLPNNKVLDQSKFKALADDNSKVIQIAKFVLDKTEDIVGKEGNAGFQKALFSGLLTVGIV